MTTYEINKILLSVFDEKRFVLNIGILTLAYFHKDLKNHRRSQIKIGVHKLFLNRRLIVVHVSSIV